MRVPARVLMGRAAGHIAAPIPGARLMRAARAPLELAGANA